MKRFVITFFTTLFSFISVKAQVTSKSNESKRKEQRAIAANAKTGDFLYGTASYYADKFDGRKTANGKSYKQDALSAACNLLPLGTWIKVTNLKNNKSIIVQVNDRLHAKNNRLLDLSKGGAAKLGYIKNGLARVQVEVLGKKKPKD